MRCPPGDRGFPGNLGHRISLEGTRSDSVAAFEEEETGLGSHADPAGAEGFSSPLQRRDRDVLPPRPRCLSFPRASWLHSAPGMVFPPWNQGFGNPASLRLSWITQDPANPSPASGVDLAADPSHLPHPEGSFPGKLCRDLLLDWPLSVPGCESKESEQWECQV